MVEQQVEDCHHFIANAAKCTYEEHIKNYNALVAERPNEYYYDLVPTDYRWHLFNWDGTKSSSKLKIGPDKHMKEMFEAMPEEFMPKNQLHCLDGGGFKTALADEPFYAQEKVFYQVRVNSGNLVKIGVARGDCDVSKAMSDGPKGFAYFDG